MPINENPIRATAKEFTASDLDQELDNIHRRLNEILIPDTVEDLSEVLPVPSTAVPIDDLIVVAPPTTPPVVSIKVNYVDTDVDTAAEVAAAFNNTNTYVDTCNKTINKLIDAVDTLTAQQNTQNDTINAILQKLRLTE